MMNSNFDITVCILFFNKVEQTIECINSFIPSNVNILVLDNNSDPKQYKLLLESVKSIKNVKIIHSDVNLGVGPGRNILINSTKSNWLFFVDNDIVVKQSNWLDLFKEELIDSKNYYDVYIPQLYSVHESSYVGKVVCAIKNNIAKILPINNYYTNIFPGGASIISRDVFIKNGLYDENMFVGYEDNEFCIRAIKKYAPFKCKYIDSIPNLSCLITPSIPPSPLLPIALPASIALPPYPIANIKSTTNCSKNVGVDFLTLSNNSLNNSLLIICIFSSIISTGGFSDSESIVFFEVLFFCQDSSQPGILSKSFTEREFGFFVSFLKTVNW